MCCCSSIWCVGGCGVVSLLLLCYCLWSVHHNNIQSSAIILKWHWYVCYNNIPPTMDSSVIWTSGEWYILIAMDLIDSSIRQRWLNVQSLTECLASFLVNPHIGGATPILAGLYGSSLEELPIQAVCQSRVRILKMSKALAFSGKKVTYYRLIWVKINKNIIFRVECCHVSWVCPTYPRIPIYTGP